MTRSHWLARGVATAAAGLFLAGLSGVGRADQPLHYPCPTNNCCRPNYRDFGYFVPHWRVWPGDENRIERINPIAVGRQPIPTPQGQEELPPPKGTATQQPPPGQEQPPERPPEQPRPGQPPGPEQPVPPPGEIVPPGGLLLPPTKPGGQPPGGEAPPGPAPGEGLPGLPELPPEPDLTRPPPPPAEKTPPKEPNKATDVPKPEGTTPPPKPKESAAVPSIRTPQWGDWREGPAAQRDRGARRQPGRQPRPPGRRRGHGPRALGWRRGLAGRPVGAGAERRPARGLSCRFDRLRTARLAGQPRGTGGVCDGRADGRPARGPGRLLPGRTGPQRPLGAGRPALDGRPRGRIYRLSGAQQRQDFLANPAGFAPVNSGNDAVLLVDQNRTVAGQPAYCATYDGRLYMFSSADTQAQFNSNPQRYAAGK